MTKKKQVKTKKKTGTKKSLNLSGIRGLILIVVVVLIIIALFVAVIKIFLTTEELTVDELHAKNRRGKLSSDEGYLYNGYSFIKANGLWWTQVQRQNTQFLYNLQFHYGPRDLENITIEGNVHDFRKHNESFVTFDPEEESHAYTALSGAELSINLAQVVGITPIPACTKNVTRGCQAVDIVTCDSGYPVIFLELTDTPAIRYNGNCLQIQGNGTDLVRSTDLLLLTWFGVMK